VLSIFGSFIAYSFGKISDHRRNAANDIDSQIERLFGPLHAYSIVNAEAWEIFVKKAPIGAPKWSDQLSDSEIELWRRWMKSVFLPLNNKIEAILTENMQLIDGAELYPVFQQFLVHATSFRAVAAKWDHEAVSSQIGRTKEENTAPVPYPDEFRQCAEARLKFAIKRRDTTRSAWFWVPLVYPDTPFSPSCRGKH
jgi:hypothetical protein